MIDWAEKYRPQTLGDIAGNSQAINQMRRWAEDWSHKIPAKKALVLAGDPGIGKTSAALALARDFGWTVVEMNASDKRNAKAVRDIALRGAVAETFGDDGSYVSVKNGGRKLVILDEADNLFGKEDMGGVGAISEVLRNSKQPIILIANDLYGLTRRSSAIKRESTIIRFQKPSVSSVTRVLRNIARNEGIKVAEDALDFIAERNEGDLRSAINDLQSLVEGREEIRIDDVNALGYRDRSKDIYSTLSGIFHGTSCKKARESVFALDEPPDYLILWIDHNVPYDYREPEDLERAYDALSRADVYLGRVAKLQYYGLWSYATDMMSCGVTSARQGRYTAGRYNFPTWLAKMSRSRGIRNTISGINRKIARHCHTSESIASRDMFDMFKFLYRTNADFRFRITDALDFTEREIGFLLEEKDDSNVVRRLVEAISKTRAKEKDEKEIFADYEKEDKAHRKKVQKSLGEY